MTLLSITASFGALVFIFQDGNFSNVLGFESPGFTIAGNPIIMFSVLFGLSMDYEVLLLSRIQEAYRRTGDNTASVAEGLAKTAGVITGAALIMVTVFSAFALAESITIKSIGVGHGDRGPHRRDDRPGPARPGHDAAAWAGGTGGRPGRSAGSPTGSGSATSRTSSTCAGRGRDGVGRRRRAGLPGDDRRSRRLAGDGDPHPSRRDENRSGVSYYGWRWGRDEQRRPGLPWIGIFLVVFGGAAAPRAGAARSTAASATSSSSRRASRRSSPGRSGAARSRSTPARS